MPSKFSTPSGGGKFVRPEEFVDPGRSLGREFSREEAFCCRALFVVSRYVVGRYGIGE